MGIQGLTKLLSENTKGALREVKFESYFGRKVAIDASMHIYQFMAVVGRQGEQQLTSEAGDVTSHLQGMFNRTVRMLDAGIRPVYVFDGKPPTLKSGELAKRKEKREAAVEALAEAKEAGNAEEAEKFAKRDLKVTREHNEECKRLLRLMGVPVVEAPSEAEASCAELCKHGKVYAAASEDMDTLTFFTPKLAKNLMAPASAEKPVMEIDTAKVIEELGITLEQFVDVCILCGCDYCDSIRGIGPNKALQFIKEHGNIEGEYVKKSGSKSYVIPEYFPFDEARRLFLQPEVVDVAALEEFKWNTPDEEGLIQFLVREKTFNEDRVKSAIAKIKAAKGKASQGRLESFFSAATVHHSTKRAEPEPKGKGKGKGKEAAGPAAKKSKGVGGGKK